MEQLSLFNDELEYVTTEEELKETLSNEEKILLCRQGEYSVDQFIEENKKLVYKMITHFSATKQVNQNDIQDYESVGLLGLYKAMQDWDVDRNIKFSTFACRYILTEFHMYKRKHVTKHEYHSRYALTLNSMEMEVVSNDINVMDRHTQGQYNLEGIRLTPKQREIYLAYLENPSPTALAKQFGISKQCVNDCVKRTQKKMRDKYYAH